MSTTTTNNNTTKPVDPRAELVNQLKEAKDKTAHLEALWKTSEEKKDPMAAEFLAAVYGSGIPDFKIEKDAEKATQALENGVKFGSTTCMIAKGETSKDLAQASQYFQAALDAKDFRAANSLGVVALKNGNLTEAIAKFELAASHNVDRAAQNLLISRMQAAINAQQTSLAFMSKALSVFASRAPPAAAKEDKGEPKDEEKSKEEAKK